MVSEKLKLQFERIRGLRFPSMGYDIGDFPLYDSGLMGVAASMMSGHRVDAEGIPSPDLETMDEVARLRSHPVFEAGQAEFLAYYTELEKLRLLLEELAASA